MSDRDLSDSVEIEDLRVVRAEVDDFSPTFEAEMERQRQMYGRQSDLFAKLGSRVIRALGAGASVAEVAEAAGFRVTTYLELEAFHGFLTGHLRTWLVREFPETIR